MQSILLHIQQEDNENQGGDQLHGMLFAPDAAIAQ
jgi:hypothetical protein